MCFQISKIILRLSDSKLNCITISLSICTNTCLLKSNIRADLINRAISNRFNQRTTQKITRVAEFLGRQKTMEGEGSMQPLELILDMDWSLINSDESAALY